MLAWKWWRDCRGRVILYCVGALVMGVFAAIDGTAFSAWIERFKGDPQRYQFYVFLTWNRVGYGLESPATWGAIWMGLALAITSFGRDYASPAASFMVTRPRRRIAMLWTDWALTQATVVIAAALLVGSAVLITSRLLPDLGRASELWVMFPPAIALAVTVYGLALFWTAATRSAVRGVELSIATMLVFTLAPGALLEWWHIAWPDRLQNWMLQLFGWRSLHSYWIDNPFRTSIRANYYARPVIYHSLEPYPIAALAIWIGLGLALTYATQKIMERREI
jgi:hypothetical protein